MMLSTHFSNKKIFNRFSIVWFVLGAAMVLFLVLVFKNDGNLTAQVVRQNNSSYHFIKPFLYTEYDSPDYGKELFEFEKDIHDGVNEIISQNPEITTSFYFKDLTNPSWIGINHEEKFIPASLLKVPRLIAYYKLREKEPGLFERQFKYAGEDLNSMKTLGPKGNVVPGGTYSIQQLLEEMIVNSDNNAYEMLRIYKPGAMKSIFEDLDAPFLDDPELRSKQDFLTVDKVSKFFLVLYNATYLTRDDSEEALELLSKANFNDGIRIEAGKPFPISHKFGERIIGSPNSIQVAEFHDCGILYYQPKPYILCVMTKGKDIGEQVKITKNISQKVYEIVSEHYQ
jgi:beta-lactamase class A